MKQERRDLFEKFVTSLEIITWEKRCFKSSEVSKTFMSVSYNKEKIPQTSVF